MWWERDGLESEGGRLFFAGHDTVQLAKKYGTPLYVYDGNRVRKNYRRFKEAFGNTDRELRIHYAMKANSNHGILKLLNEEGAWIDAVSPHEVGRALECGFRPEKILYTGTSISNKDLFALRDYGARVNVDKYSQLLRMRDRGMAGPISLRLNPGRGGVGHNWRTITAGKEAHGRPIKFGIPESEFNYVCEEAMKYGFDITGVHMHVGSQWTTQAELKEFFSAADVLLEKANDVTKLTKHGLEFVDFGGGPGIKYKPGQKEFPLQDYADGICKRAKDSGLWVRSIAIEPGRSIVGDAGILLAEANTTESMYGNWFIGLNAGMETLVRPTMYGSYHEIVNCNRTDGQKVIATVAGHCCESGDLFATKRKMPYVSEGDIVGILNAGAYGYTMASNYNLWPMPKELLIVNGKILGDA